MAVYKTKKPTKDGRSYYFRIKYKDIFGKTHDYSSSKYKNKKDAETEEAKYRIKINEIEHSNSKITLNQVFIEYIEAKRINVKPQSLLKDETLFKYYKNIANKEINKIDLNEYKNWKRYIDSLKYTPNYKNKILGLFRALLKYSNKYYNTSINLLKFIENYKNIGLKKEMDFFTYEEYLQFDSVIDNHMWHTFFEMLYYLGLRKGECMALTWNDINFDSNQVTINKNIVTKIKGHKWLISSPKTKNSIRVLPMTKKLSESLKKHQENQKEYKDYSNNWFVFGNTHPLAETTITEIKNKYCDQANLRRIRIHDFRHSCASLLINKGANISLVSRYLGHAKISTTLNTYTHMYKNDLEKMINVLDNM